jgi:acyl-CoA synthetase (AMP-forming)/AMP-acid ligase II
VAICAQNHLEHLVAWLATLAAEKTWVPLYPANGRAEIARCIAFTEASIVCADRHGAAKVGAGGFHRVDLDGTGDREATPLAELIERHRGERPRRRYPPLDATQAIKFTGGTTGAPKGVQQPYRAWNTNIATQRHCWALTADDRYLTAAPITHGTSTYIMPMLAAGGTLVLVDRPKPAEVLAALAERDVSLTFVPPTTIYMMMAEPGIEALRFPRLRHLIYGSAPMRPGEIERAQRLFGPVVAATFGQTEAPQIATCITARDLLRPEKRASVGRATPLTLVEVVDAEGRVLPPGEEGEVVIRGDLLMTGYWRQPAKTAETLKDGWLHTGDVGVFDEEGFLFLKGRLKDVVITGGFNVYPADVEPVLGRHPDVRDCAIFGVPDDKWGEAVWAAVELVPDAAATPEALIAFVKAELGSVKAPKHVVVYDQLPRNAYGKLQKQALVDTARDAAPRGGSDG